MDESDAVMALFTDADFTHHDPGIELSGRPLFFNRANEAKWFGWFGRFGWFGWSVWSVWVVWHFRRGH